MRTYYTSDCVRPNGSSDSASPALPHTPSNRFSHGFLHLRGVHLSLHMSCALGSSSVQTYCGPSPPSPLRQHHGVQASAAPRPDCCGVSSLASLLLLRSFQPSVLHVAAGLDLKTKVICPFPVENLPGLHIPRRMKSDLFAWAHKAA